MQNHIFFNLDFLQNQLFETPEWMINKEILNKIEFAGITNRIRSTQSRTLNSLLDFGKMARLIENEAINGKNAYSLIEMMTDLRKGIFNEVYKNKTIDVYRRNLQLAYLDRISYLMSNEQGSTPSWARNYVTSVKVSQSDIRTVAANQLIELRKDLKKHKNKSDKMTKMHLEMVKNKKTKEPFEGHLNMGDRVANMSINNGLICRPLGPAIVLCPQFIITKAQIDEMFNNLHGTLKQVF